MDTILIEDLTLFGTHGHGAEKYTPQPFTITVAIRQWERRFFDSLENTFDYLDAFQIAKDVVENKTYDLIETVAEEIAETILKKDQKLYDVKVTVRKVKVVPKGLATVTVTRRALPSPDFLPFSFEEKIYEIMKHGAVSFPFITEEARKKLLDEAKSLSYTPQPREVSGGKVIEELESTKEFPENSLIKDFQNKVEELLWREIDSLPVKLFREPLSFNELSVQHYKEGSIGITPHMDGLSKQNLICILVLSGDSEFATCDDRLGSNPKFLDASPGNLILMRASGFLGSSHRPFHFVRNITSDRYVIGLRQSKKI